ncbi:MAG: sigma-70 family RNA polymerase sigma factor [Oscillospiraceae bacterium]|jgi:RNA polymerase sporulation-specific sigma factor|nr:sigma-70 family RNA polymerase sigma factor [Oscillospiraceae bacterium]
MKSSNDIVERNLGLVRLCANKFKGRGLEYDDLYQAGCAGLVKSSKAFDESRGIKFSSYAVPVILGEIKQLFRENTQVKVSRPVKELACKIERERKNFVMSHQTEPTIGELSEILGVDQEKILEASDALRPAISLTSQGEGEFFDFDIPVQFDDEKISEKVTIEMALQLLDENDKKIVHLRFFLLKTQSDSAKILGMTQVQVSRREKLILKNLRKILS